MFLYFLFFDSKILMLESRSYSLIVEYKIIIIISIIFISIIDACIVISIIIIIIIFFIFGSIISMFLDWVSFLTYSNLFGIKDFVAVCCCCCCYCCCCRRRCYFLFKLFFKIKLSFFFHISFLKLEPAIFHKEIRYNIILKRLYLMLHGCIYHI
jgi:hypothetical protein